MTMRLYECVVALQNSVSITSEFAATDIEATPSECLADAAVAIADIRRTLARVESDLSTEAGKRLGKHTGNLPDGRQYTLERGRDRKDWDHEDLRRTVARTVVANALADIPADADIVVLDPVSGEVTELDLPAALHDVIAKAQEMHGATTPRTTALKNLGLWAGDFCTTSPGPWRITAVAPKTDGLD